MQPNEILKEYLRKNKIPKTKFAEDIGITYQALWLILSGKRNIGAKVARAIEKATNGEIQAVWLVFPEFCKDEIEGYLNKKEEVKK